MALERTFPPHHRVLQARFEVAGSSEASLLSLREQIVSISDTALPAALDVAFHGLAEPDEVIRIAQLHVDLGEIDADGLNLSRLTAATRSALIEHLSIHEHSGRLPSCDTPLVSHSESSGPAKTPYLTRMSSRQQATLAISGYLEIGQLPAEATHLTLSELYKLLVPAPVAAAHLIAHIRDIAAQRHRIATLIRLFATAPEPLIDAIVAIAAAKRPLASALSNFPRQVLDTPASLERTATEIADTLFARGQTIATTRDVPLQLGEVTNDPTSSTSPQSVANAGLVLLAPYFTRLFSFCDLTEDGKFTSDATRAAAARLLHYLATGEAQSDEPVLTIPRLLCGVPASQPVLSLSPLEDELTDRADGLLTAAIGHWSKLGNTSPAGLRETFLMRPGVIRQTDDQLTIAVEKSGIDVLLDSLPWSISMIALPWLPNPIRVDWR